MKPKTKCEECGSRIVHKAYIRKKVVCNRCYWEIKNNGKITEEYKRYMKNLGKWKQKK